MNNDVKNRTAVAAARRRLVRGVFAAPAALTLCSGSVYAAASNRQCLAKAAAGSVDAPANPAETWVRVELRKLTSYSKSSTWVSGADLKLLQASDTPSPYLSTTQWQCFGSTMTEYEAKRVYDTTPKKGTATPQPSGQYVAVRVDASGKIIGVQGIEAGGTAMGQSCWTSINVLA